tara:strand:+ start:471 stop:647 length:177 start_codon:yes stop_codon:yes gene_type:complete
MALSSLCTVYPQQKVRLTVKARMRMYGKLVLNIELPEKTRKYNLNVHLLNFTVKNRAL